MSNVIGRTWTLMFILALASVPAFAQSAVLIRKLTKAKRPWLEQGESYRIPGSFRVTLTKATGGRAEVRLR